MAGRLLLDSNAAIALLHGDPAVEKRVRGADEVFIPVVALGELYFGAYKSQRVEANLGRIDSLAAGIKVLTHDAGTAREYGRVKNALRHKGRPIPDNDLWIAALSRRHDLILVTRDKHFSEVDGLTCETW